MSRPGATPSRSVSPRASASATATTALATAAATLLLAVGSLTGLTGCGEGAVPSGGGPASTPETVRLLDDAAGQLAIGTPTSLSLAADTYRRVLAADPDQSEARFGLGRAELLGGRTWSGLWHMLRLTHRHPDHAGGWSGLGTTYFRLGEWTDASACLERIPPIRRLAADELRALADACLRSRRVAVAESLFTVALSRDAGDADVLAARAQARRELADLDGAATDLHAALDHRDGGDGARFADQVSLAAVLIDLGRLDEADAVLIPPAPDGTPPDSVRFHVLRAHLLDRSGDPQAALHHLGTALAIDSLDVDALHLAVRVHRKLGDRDQAKEAAARHREGVAVRTFRERADALKALTQGAIAWEAGDPLAAVTAWEKGLADAPDDLSLHCVLAPAYQMRADRTRARASFTVLRHAMGGAAPGPLFLATGSELRRRGLPGLAAEQYGLAVSRMPRDARALFHRARALAELGDWDAAVEAAAPLEGAPGPSAPAGPPSPTRSAGSPGRK